MNNFHVTETYDVAIYSSGWRNGAVNQCLEFAFTTVPHSYSRFSSLEILI